MALAACRWRRSASSTVRRRAAGQLDFVDAAPAPGCRRRVTAASPCDSVSAIHGPARRACTKESTKVLAMRSNTGLISRLERRRRRTHSAGRDSILQRRCASVAARQRQRREAPGAVEQRERPVDERRCRPISVGHVDVARREAWRMPREGEVQPRRQPVVVAARAPRRARTTAGIPDSPRRRSTSAYDLVRRVPEQDGLLDVLHTIRKL